MYNDLINTLRHCAECDHQGCAADCRFGKKYPLNFICIEYLQREAADAIEDLSEQLDEETEYATALNSYVPQWIPVTERLPEIGENVLLYAYARVHFGKLLFLENNLGHPTFLMEQSGLQHAPVLETTTKGRITHWMPLPEPPESDGEA